MTSISVYWLGIQSVKAGRFESFRVSIQVGAESASLRKSKESCRKPEDKCCGHQTRHDRKRESHIDVSSKDLFRPDKQMGPGSS
jgi:hypothetical protein